MRVRLLRLLLLAAAESALAAAPSCAPSPSGPSPITQHITSPDSSDAPDLVRQSLEPIARDATQRTRERRVPHAPPATIDQGRLEWEYAETRAFLDKQLNHDPRLQPTDIVVDTDHMRRCTSCAHDRGLHDVLTGDSGGAPETVAGSIDVGGRTQLLVDDYVIAAWRNVVRVLEPPKRKRALDSSLDAHGDYRFGCPCSTFEDAEGNVRLYYQSGPSIYGGEEDTWEEDHNGRYSFRISPDGETGWSEEHGPIRINGRDGLGTMSVEAGKRGAAYSLPPRSGHAGTEGGMLFVSGYEGWRSRACLAFSSDGRDFYNLDDEADRRNPGLNDDCLSAPGVRGSNSVFARAADVRKPDSNPRPFALLQLEFLCPSSLQSAEGRTFESHSGRRMCYQSSTLRAARSTCGGERTLAPPPAGARCGACRWLSWTAASPRFPPRARRRASGAGRRSGTSTASASSSATGGTRTPSRSRLTTKASGWASWR